MISWLFIHYLNSRPNINFYYNNSMMTRCNSRSHIPRFSYNSGFKRFTLRYNLIYYFRSLLLFRFFWAYFHRRLAPRTELGSCWPPIGITPLNPFEVPLLNTGVLLASGVTVTWAHHSLIEGNRTEGIQGLIATVALGVYFTFLQAIEYYEASFTIADGAYGSTFFVATGFHGLHVLIGRTFLTVCLARVWLQHFSTGHHFGFEAAAWYWHFVDVVWLFLYLSIYWWGY